MKLTPITYFLLFVLPTLLEAQVFQANSRNEILLQLRSGASIHSVLGSLQNRRSSHVELKKELAPDLGYYLLSCPAAETCDALIAALREQSEVNMVMPNLKVEFRDSVPNDPLFNLQWDMKKIMLPQVWSTTTGGLSANGDEIVIAVLDKGFDLTHFDIDQNVWINKGEIPGDNIDNDGNGFIDDIHGWNFRRNSNNFNLESHGTWVSGILGAKGNNNLGPAGVNWNVKIMFLGIEYVDEVVSAFNYVLKQRELYNSSGGKKGAFVVVTNGSFGIDKVQCSSQPAWGAMYDPLGAAGVLNVAATANENWDVDIQGDIPTSCTSEFLIAVTSTDSNDIKVSNAAYGKKSVDLGAPGRRTVTIGSSQTIKEDFSGTSSASPHVAAAIALLYSVPCKSLANFFLEKPSDAAKLMRQAIFENVDQVNSLKNKTATGGRLNVFKAMQYLHAWCIAKPSERVAASFKETYFTDRGIVRVYPNPASDKLFIDYSNDGFSEIKMNIFNSFGQFVKFRETGRTAPFIAQTIELDISDWPNGTYFINLFDNQKKITFRFIKMK